MWQIAGVKELLSEHSSSDDDLDKDQDLEQHLSLSSTGSPADFIFNMNPSHAILSHPPASQRTLLFKHFLTVVHPIMPILHRPSLQTFLQSASSSTQYLEADSAYCALLFSIYFAAIVTMAEAECMVYLGVSRSLALLKYRRSAENALARAEFMSKPGIVKLQALSIYVVRYQHLTITLLVCAHMKPLTNTKSSLVFEQMMKVPQLGTLLPLQYGWPTVSGFIVKIQIRMRILSRRKCDAAFGGSCMY